jgi:hypothetical protein
VVTTVRTRTALEESEAGLNRLFPDLPARLPRDPRPEELGAVGGPMDGGYVQVSNVDLPAGYTYFAQFVFHDLTSGTRPLLNLRPLYGDGPAHSSHLYDDRGLLRTGRPLARSTVCDVPRDRYGTAVIGDRRNDRTVMLSQLHAAFLQLHNLMLATLNAGRKRATFSEARQRMERQYRRLIAIDLLPRLVGCAAIDRAVRERAEGPCNPRTMLPLEFTLAVGRVGHAMVKPRYRLNDALQAIVLGDRGESVPFGDLRGQPLDETAQIDWAHFFPVGNPGNMQRSAKLNTKICRPLLEMPMPDAPVAARSIAYRTLLAAEKAGLPAGQDVARALGFEPLSDDVLWRGTTYQKAQAPLWFYVLREAEHERHGLQLGNVGASITARVIVDALAAHAHADESQPVVPPAANTVGELLSAVAAGRLRGIATKPACSLPPARSRA